MLITSREICWLANGVAHKAKAVTDGVVDVEGDAGGPVGVVPLLDLWRRHAPPVRPADYIRRPFRRRRLEADGEEEETAGRRRSSIGHGQQSNDVRRCSGGFLAPSGSGDQIFEQETSDDTNWRSRTR